MDTEGSGDELRRALRVLLDALELGDWRAVLFPGIRCPRDLVITGSRRQLRLVVLLRLVARSMQLQTHTQVHDAWDRLGQASVRLPTWYRRPDDRTRAALRPKPRDDTVESEAAWRLAMIIWREQWELHDLRARFAHGLMRPREELVQACIQHLVWVDFDPYSSDRPRLATCGPAPDRSRSSLCLRASRLRQFADPRACDVSQSVWRDIGAFPGLCAEALDRLAEPGSPAPWCADAGVAGPRIRRGRYYAWDYAVKRRADLDYWK